MDFKVITPQSACILGMRRSLYTLSYSKKLQGKKTNYVQRAVDQYTEILVVCYLQ